jgi:hypothetical protein
MSRSLVVVVGIFVILLGNLLVSAMAADASDKEKGWKPLFNGKTLAGWHKVGDGDWVVEDGAIVGKTATAAKLYGLLVSDKKYKNLKVRFQFKSLHGNSGFYIRGYIESPDRANGLQIEVDPRGSTGGIYESYKRAWISQPSSELVKTYYRLDQWNEMLITAEGGHVVVKVNGVQSAELKNDPVQAAGHLILQMHAGNEMLVMFKDIEVLELP